MEKETAAQLRAKQHKLDMVKNILNRDSDLDSVSGDSAPRSMAHARHATAAGRLVPTSSEPDLSSSSAEPSTPIRTGHVRAMTAAYTQPNGRAVPRTTRGKSPPPTKPVSPSRKDPRCIAKNMT